MTRARQIIIVFFIISILAWVLNLYLKDVAFSGRTVIKEAIYITGVISFLFMSLIMLLSIRPRWLEHFLGGMDKLYYLHKWAGILAIAFAGFHYLIELSKPLFAILIEQGAKQSQTDISHIELFLRQFRSFAKDIAEYSMYFLLLMLALTLWKKFPYKLWRYIHKLMAPIFLLLAFHTVILAPISYWVEPIGILLFIAITTGVICAIIATFGLIGKKSKFKGEIIEINYYEDLIEITCRLSGKWRHYAGQYAFLKTNRFEGAHPFTIFCADKGQNIIRFSIKALGDYTSQLKNHILVGGQIEIEGPYGLFNYQYSQAKHQIWIGAGIGITPFIAWLEQMIEDNNTEISVDLYYCVSDKNKAIHLSYLHKMCASLPNVKLYPHYSSTDGYLTLSQLNFPAPSNKNISDIWFCGPNEFAKSLKKDIRGKMPFLLPHFHQEFFQMR